MIVDANNLTVEIENELSEHPGGLFWAQFRAFWVQEVVLRGFGGTFWGPRPGSEGFWGGFWETISVLRGLGGLLGTNLGSEGFWGDFRDQALE